MMMMKRAAPLIQILAKNPNKISKPFQCTFSPSSIATFKPTLVVRSFSQINTLRQGEDEDIVVKKFVTPEFYFKSKKELNQIFTDAIGPIISSITQEDNYTPHDIPGFILGEANLRFKVFTQTMAKFGREIPSRDLPKIITVQQLIDWYVTKVESEKPKASYTIPDNVKMYIEKHEKIRQREENRKAAFAIREKKETQAMRKHKSLYGDTDLTPEQVQEIKKNL